ncbi:penicillin acylase family protein [Alcanivorax sp. JB21]|uniref:penicillin acylase family protein n=1 Tax=Alcanivorax limicola TaxID=2874102 RepID=UPI001CBFA08F|nr:penicillin acylase family protein [Alcanivorax limicola]MBZ2190261.1 penicillin acylase family protein [Alcanivorax limicola]
MLIATSRGIVPLLCMLGVTATLTACGGSSSSRSDTQYSATIERTTYGVPHITADDYAGLGYGHGYAIAEDNLCTLADAYVTFRGERSRYFGPTAAASSGGTFGTPNNRNADYFFRFVVNDDVVDTYVNDQPQDLRDLSRGFAAGFSRYVREVQGGEHAGRHQSCRDAEWLAEIDEQDVFRRLVALNLAASAANWVSEIATAAPPAGGEGLSMPLSEPTLDADRVAVGQKAGIGSNTYSFGTDATEGSALNFANPHWYLDGVDRFYQVQLTLPGSMDISGATIMGTPMVLMGFNDDIAWAHTVSTARRFTLYGLMLNENDATQYVFDGAPRDMEAVEISIQVKQEDDSLATETRTLYRSHYGPMINLAGLGLPTWGANNMAFTLRDVNLENTRTFRNFFEWGQAASLEEFLDIARTHVAIPWVNTAAVSRHDDRALYSDITAVPNVPDAHRDACLVPTLGPAVLQMVPGLPLLQGWTSACDWLTDEDSAQPGAFGPDNLPYLLRNDYVANMNDSYWLSNPDEPLTGYAGIIGREDYQQSLRTRMGHILARERLDGSDGLGGDKATSDTLREIVLNSRNLSAELLKDDVLNVVCGNGDPSDDEQAACAALSAWDNTGSADARGAHVWTAVWQRIRSIEGLFATPFDAGNAVDTPADLNTADSDVIDALNSAFAQAVVDVADSGADFDAQLGDLRPYPKAGHTIPHYGGEGSEGYFTVLRNTYMHVVDFPEDESVRAYTLMAPSQSTDPANPHYADYTQAYADGNWHRVPYTRAQIEAERISLKRLRE